MKIRYIKANKWLIGMMLTLLGFSGCDDKNEFENTEPAMYGTPYATHTIKAKVLNNNQQPIEGINIVVKNHNLTVDSVFTDNKGEASITNEGTRYLPDYSIGINDVDNEQNGNYKNTTDSVSFKSADYTGGEGWNMGHAQKEITVTMEEKPEN